MSASKRFPRAACALVVVAGLQMLAGQPAWAEVTVYEKAPSVEELQQKLMVGGKGEQKKFKTRAIVFGDAGNEQAPVAQPPAPPPSAVGQAAPASQPAPAPFHQAAQQPGMAPATAGMPATVQVSENAIAFPIQFKVNSAQILPESIPFLQSIAGLMQKDPTLRLLIEGHTDISGNYQRNMSLSRERAFAVMNYLIDRFGIDPMRLMPIGKGPMEPLPGLEPTDPKNRRVQFRILG